MGITKNRKGWWHGIQASQQGALGPGRARRWGTGETDGLTAAISVQDGTAVDPYLSFAAWINTTQEGPRTICGLYNTGQDEGMFDLQMSNDEILGVNIETDAGTGTLVYEETIDLHDGEWHLVAAAVELYSSGAAVPFHCWVDGTQGAYFIQTHSRATPTFSGVGVGVRHFDTPIFHWDGDIDEVSFWDGYFLTQADNTALYALGNDSSKRYFNNVTGVFGDASVQTPTAHWSLSELLNPTNIGKDEVGSVDLTDDGTEDVEGIPAGD